MRGRLVRRGPAALFMAVAVVAALAPAASSGPSAGATSLRPFNYIALKSKL